MLKQIPPITRNLLAINIICFLAQLVAEQRGYDLAQLLGLHFYLADHFEPWQLVSYMFLHGSFTHLFFNMFSLWMFGRIVEQTMGARRFLIYFFVCGIGAGLCQEGYQAAFYYLNHLYEFPTVNLNGVAVIPMGEYLDMLTTIGASGACYGILLAFGIAYPNERIMLLIPPIPIKAKYFVVGYAIIEIISAYTVDDNVAHFAHLGGMLFGLLLILFWRRTGRNRGNGFRNWETWTPSRSRTFWERFSDRMHRIRKRGWRYFVPSIQWPTIRLHRPHLHIPRFHFHWPRFHFSLPRLHFHWPRLHFSLPHFSLPKPKPRAPKPKKVKQPKPKKEKVPKQKKEKVEKPKKHFKDRNAEYAFNAKTMTKQQLLEKVLEKIRTNGYQSLSPDEKKLLFDKSKR